MKDYHRLEQESPNHDEDPAKANPKVIAMLGSAGITEVDMQLFDTFRRHDFATFVHGSIIENRITPKSDVDFTLVGMFDRLPSGLRDTLAPGLVAVQSLKTIHYISTSVKSQAGRKVSMHISEPSFRENYPLLNQPYATEYRPAQHAKSGPRDYFLAGIDRHSNVRLMNVSSQSELLDDGGTVTDIPQTGLVTVNGNNVYGADGKIDSLSVKDIINVWSNGDTDTSLPQSAEEVMMLGLEFDKMQSDTPVYSGDDVDDQVDRYVSEPSRRSMDQLGEYTGVDPAVVTRRLYGELAQHWSKIKPHKSR